ncbi:ABC transporter permease [Kosmotoga pacifica]|uniref:Peptide ABC transporter permease n=1 Tax=Kosmotoga pacifica TaxID=1330330 RepID=A0A0G2Z9A0_9BACT|nr:ABC transporter permease [Kosmotoga pacifica]AKI96651.1 peptide ABC transporter permease [Kosmotoga pacifica]
MKIKNEFLFFALRNVRLRIGITIVSIFVLLAIFGPYLTKYGPLDYAGPGYHPPSAEYWFGTTTFGQDVFSQLVNGLRSTFMVGLVGGGLATFLGLLIGFVSGYRGGFFDEILMMITNIILVIPTMALLIILASYLTYRGVFMESLFIGFTAWPWTARAVRSQTLSLRTREFVNLARITGMKPLKIIITEIMPNMMSYVFMVFILQFGGAILTAATLDFIGLGPTQGISLGLMMQQAVLWNAIQLGMWWWAIPPGLAITAIVGALYFMNTGLDEVFNPKLREM